MSRRFALLLAALTASLQLLATLALLDAQMTTGLALGAARPLPLILEVPGWILGLPILTPLYVVHRLNGLQVAGGLWALTTILGFDAVCWAAAAYLLARHRGRSVAREAAV